MKTFIPFSDNRAEFDSLLLVEKIAVQPKSLWQLRRDLAYWSPMLDNMVVVPKDFITDFASVPRLMIAYALFGGKADEAAVVHDWLYSVQQYPRAVCDAVLKEAIEALNYSKLTSLIMYLGVRLGGWVAWYSKNVPQPVHVANEAPEQFDVRM